MTKERADLSKVVGEVLGDGYPDWPDDLTTYAERKAYQLGVAHARAVAGAQEPVGMVHARNRNSTVQMQWFRNPGPKGTKLYLAPQHPGAGIPHGDADESR